MLIEKLEKEKEEVNIKFANLNKNNRLADYYYEVYGRLDYNKSKVIYNTIIHMDEYEWYEFINTLLQDKEILKKEEGIIKGGTRKENEEYKVLCIVFQNDWTFEKIFVDTEGYSYARYVGIY